MIPDIFDPFIEKCGVVILDGAMATELEKRGADLNHVLWSAKLLTENPDLIREVHRDYLEAGADIITTCSYQASFPGFSNLGVGKEKAIELMKLSTRLAIRAREDFIQQTHFRGPVPLTAASVGPYGASLADGSEYRGNYGLSIEELMSFHRERLHILSESGVDLLAFETIPCPEEAIALIRLLKEIPGTKAWLSFSCKNATELCDGSLFSDGAALANDSVQVIAVGVNCTAPQFVESLITIAGSATHKKILAYPNKGDVWDAHHKCWIPTDIATDFVQQSVQWRNAGATLIGGCCRSSPEDIRNIRRVL